jgi:hypothetical protein
LFTAGYKSLADGGGKSFLMGLDCIDGFFWIGGLLVKMTLLLLSYAGD